MKKTQIGPYRKKADLLGPFQMDRKKNSGPGRTRTCNRLIRSQTRYPITPQAHVRVSKGTLGYNDFLIMAEIDGLVQRMQIARVKQSALQAHLP